MLGLNAEAPRDRAVQWRQLVELVARSGGDADPTLLKRALERIAELRPEVPDAVRASAARAIAGLKVPFDLVAIFVADGPEVVAPMLGAADFGPAGWDELRAHASPQVQALIESISPSQARGAPATKPREPSRAPADASSGPGLFRWECGPSGDVDWVDGVPRAAVVGLSLANQLPRPFATHQPFEDEPLVVSESGDVGGAWLWSGVPRFEPRSGRFAGYAGVARREGTSLSHSANLPVATPAVSALDSESLRELIHELRTPLTAIIGFGEIIEGQFLGPAHRAYRTRAGEIVRQARRLLGAVDELDLAAKLRSATPGQSSGAPVAGLVDDLSRDLSARLHGRGAAIRTEVRQVSGRYALDQELAERLIRRFAEAVADALVEGERIDMIVDRIGSQVALSLDRPRAAAGLSEAELFDPSVDVGGGTGLGLGFSLRLVRGLARIAGGELDVGAGRIVLLLPAAASDNG